MPVALPQTHPQSRQLAAALRAASDLLGPQLPLEVTKFIHYLVLLEFVERVQQPAARVDCVRTSATIGRTRTHTCSCQPCLVEEHAAQEGA